MSEKCYCKSHLKEICRAPVRLLIVGKVGPFTEVMKCESAVNPSLTLNKYIELDVRQTHSKRSPPKHRRHAGQHAQTEVQLSLAQEPMTTKNIAKSKTSKLEFGRRPEESRRRRWSGGRREGSLGRRGCLLWQTATHHTAEVREKLIF